MPNTGPAAGALLVTVTNGATDYLVSTEIVALTHLWDAQIVSFDAPQYAIDTLYGGYCRLGMGSVVFFPTIFEDSWPPPIQLEMLCQYTATTEAEAETFFSGTVHLKAFNRESVTYDFYGPNEDVNLLAEGTNYNGDTVPYPRAFGVVSQQPALRLADAGGGNQRYCQSSITGTAANCGTAGGDIWCVYDDGVDISANVTNVSGNVFELTSAPVGEVTISGTGEDTTLAGIFQWACGASYLNYTYSGTYAESPSPSVSYYAASQTKMVDFLSAASAFFGHLFYVAGTTLNLVSMASNNGTQTTDEFSFFPLQYSYGPPIKSITASWELRESYEGRTSDALTTAQYVRVTTQETSVESTYAYGQEINIEPYSTTKSVIDTRLTTILATLHKPIVNWRIPVQGSLPVPGKKISWTDTSLIADIDCFIRARTIKFDFDNWEVIVEGEGEVTAA